MANPTDGMAELLGKLDKLIGQVEKLEDKTDKFLDKLAQSFATFAKDMKGVDLNKLEALKNILKEIGGIKFDTATGVASAFVGITKAINEISKLDAARVAQMDTAVRAIASVVTSLGGLTISQQRMTKALQAITSFFTTMNKVIDSGGAKNIIDLAGLQAQGQAISEIIAIVQRISSAKGLKERNIKLFARAINSVQDVMKAMARFSEAGGELLTPDQITTRISSLSGVADSLFLIFEKLRKTTGTSDKIKTVAILVRAIVTFISQLSKIEVNDNTIKAVGIIKLLFDKLGDSINDLTMVAAAATPQQLGQINSLVRSLIGIMRAFEKMPASQNASLANLQAIVGILAELQNIMTKAAVIAKGDSKKIITEIASLMRGLSSLLSSIKSVPKDVTSFMTAMQVIVKSLGQFSSVRSTGFSGIANLLKEVTNLIRFLKDIKLVFGGVTIGGSRRLVKYLQGIRPFTKVLADALRSFASLPDVRGVSSIGKLFTALMEMITYFKEIKLVAGGTTIGGSRRLVKYLQGIRPFTKVLADALSSFSKIQNIREISSIGGLLNSLIETISFFKKIELVFGGVTIGGSRRLVKFLQGIRPFTKVLAKALNNFRKIKASPEQLASVAAVIRSLVGIIEAATKAGAIADPKNLKNLSGAIGEIAKALAQGLSDTKIQVEFKNIGKKHMAEYFKGVNDEAETASPSRRMMRIGGDLIAGLQKGIEAGKALIRNSAKALANAFMLPLLQYLREGAIKAVAEIRNMAQRMRQEAQNQFRGGLMRITSGGIMSFLFGQTAQGAMDFRQVLNQIQIFGKLTTEELDNVQAAIEEFSAATIFGPSQSAEAFLGLQKAGLDAAEAMRVLPDIGNLAAAANIDLAYATDLVIQTMNGFGLSFDQATRVVNTFVAGADISTAAVEDLAKAMGFVGPIANQMGISIEEVNAALALLSDRGIMGERAGTGLRAILQSLVAPTEEAAGTLAELGITLKDTEGNFVGMDSLIRQFADAIQTLRDSGMGDIQIIEMLSSLGDRNAISALFALIDEGSGSMITLADGTQVAATAFDEYLAAMDDANTAQDVANAQMDTAKGAITSLLGSMQNLKNKALDPLLEGAIKPLAKALTGFVNAIARIDERILASIAGFILLTSVLITLSGVLKILAAARLMAMAQGLNVLAFSLSAIFSPWGLIGGIIKFGLVFGALTPIIIGVGGAAAIFFEDMKNSTSGLRTQLQFLWFGIKTFFTELSGLVSDIINLFRVFGGEAQTSMGDATTAISPFASAVQSINRALAALINQMRSVRDAAQLFTGMFSFLNTDFDARSAEEAERHTNNLLEERAGILREIEAIRNGNLSSIEGLADAEQRYIIQSGDNLTKIANAYGVSVQDLLDANPWIENPNLIFTGQELTIPIGGADQEAVDAYVNDLLVRLDDIQLELGGEILSPSGQELRLDELSRLQELLIKLSGTRLGKFLGLDDDSNLFNVLAIAQDLQRSFSNIGFHLRKIKIGFRSLFSGRIKVGLKFLESSIAGISFELLSIFSTLFGFEIPEVIEDTLGRGDLRGALEAFADFVIRGFLDLGEEIGIALAFGVEFALRSGLVGVARIIADIFGLDFLNPILDLIDSYIGVIGEAVRSIVTNIFSVIRGDISPSDAIGNVFSDIRDAIDNDPNLSAISELLDAAFAGLDFSIITDEFNDLKKSIGDLIGGESFRNFTSTFGELIGIITGLIVHAAAVAIFELIVGTLDTLNYVVSNLEPLLDGFTAEFQAMIDEFIRFQEDGDPAKMKKLGSALVVLGVGLAFLLAPLIAAGAATILAAMGGLAVIGGGLLALYAAYRGVESAWDDIVALFGDLEDMFKAISDGDWEGAANSAERALGHLVDAIVNFVTGFGAALGEVAWKVADLFLTDEQMADAIRNAELLATIFDFVYLHWNLAWAKIKLGFRLFLNDLAQEIIDFSVAIPGLGELFGIDDPEALRRSLDTDIDERVVTAIGDVEDARTELENAERRIDELAEDVFGGGKTIEMMYSDIELITTEEGIQAYQNQLDAMLADPRFADIVPELTDLRATAELREIEITGPGTTTQRDFEIAFSRELDNILQGAELGREDIQIEGWLSIIRQLMEIGLAPDQIKEIVSGLGLDVVITDALVDSFEEIDQVAVSDLSFGLILETVGITLDDTTLNQIIDDSISAAAQAAGTQAQRSLDDAFSDPTFMRFEQRDFASGQAVAAGAYVQGVIGAWGSAVSLGFDEADVASMLRSRGVDESLIAILQQNSGEILSGEYTIEIPELGITVTPDQIYASLDIVTDIIPLAERGRSLDNIVALMGLDELTPDQQEYVTSGLQDIVTTALEEGMNPEDIVEQLGDLGIDTALAEAIVNDVQDFTLDGDPLAANFEELGVQMVDGVIVGIEEQGPEAITAIEDVANSITEGAADVLQTRSPSKVFKQIGKDVIDGMILGIKNREIALTEQLQSVLNVFVLFQSQLDIILAGIAYSIGEAFNVQPPTLPGGGYQLPTYHSGGWTGDSGGEFTAKLKPREYVVPEDGTLVMRDGGLAEALFGGLSRMASAMQTMTPIQQPHPMAGAVSNYGGGASSVTFGDVTINVPEGTPEVTPDIIANGIRLYSEQNPPQRIIRNRL